VQLEVSESRYRSVELGTLIERSLRALRRLGVLREGEDAPVEDGGRLRVAEIVTLDPAYVIYDLRHAETTGGLREALGSADAISAGRSVSGSTSTWITAS
jgi:hypothetical protein